MGKVTIKSVVELEVVLESEATNEEMTKYLEKVHAEGGRNRIELMGAIEQATHRGNLGLDAGWVHDNAALWVEEIAGVVQATAFVFSC